MKERMLTGFFEMWRLQQEKGMMQHGTITGLLILVIGMTWLPCCT